MLDLVSNGRAELGTGESSTFAELEAFHVSRTEKRAMWRESLVAVCRMMVEEPFRGRSGQVPADATAQHYSQADSEAASSGMGGLLAPGDHRDGGAAGIWAR